MIKTGLTEGTSAVADTTLDNLRFLWCDDGYFIAYDSSGFHRFIH